MYHVVMTAIVETTLSTMLRESGKVLREAEERDVVLHRRNGSDMMLVARERELGIRDALATAARALQAALGEEALRTRLLERLSDELAWTRFLTDEGREEFLREFAGTVGGCVETGVFDPLAQTLREWKATAAVYANPKLLATLRREPDQERPRVPRPAG